MSLTEVLERLRAAEQQAGRPTGSVRLVAVSKGQPLERIREQVLARGHFPLAENRGQELRDKAAQLGPEVEWHFIGPLQRNKIKYLRPVRLIHTIETLWQAEALAEAAHGWGHAPELLLQRHNGEAQKHGSDPHELPGLLRAVQDTGLTVRGLMTMAPYGDPQRAEQVFADTARQAHDLGLGELSMGMSDDFPLAVQYGATLVRVGRLLFEDDPAAHPGALIG
ncbi:YggS family pyridoxal phosphate enzyme [Deinococcus sonorensis]|uniref:Pyridoxal phosphate homeostasis protein n=2 Tax=Deinococcus sonorensis TaxID=309891 RepID=A0AAU7U907_9DEIO